MAVGYVRQAAANISTGLVINASDLNNEYNAIQSAFDASAGHDHDGTTGGGSPIPLAGLASLTALSIIGNGTNASAVPTAITGTADQVLIVNHAGTSLAFGQVSLTAGVTGVLPVANGGTNLSSGTSGGILGYTASGVLASSVALTANALVLGGGAGATPTPMASLGTTTTVLHGNAAGAPTWAAVSLTADVSGVLPIANGGTGSATVGTANIVFASPNGATGAPSFRALVGADLPNPSASTLGGVQSIAAVSHNFLTSISTSGVPAQAQPAFSDISGTIAAGQIANSTLTNAMNANMADGTIKSNISGAGAAPADNTISAVLDKQFGTTQGTIVFRGASSWSALTPPSISSVLTITGSAANPAWSGRFVSSQQAIPASGNTLTVAHGLGAAPFATYIILHNITGEGGWSSGDETNLASAHCDQNGGNDSSIAVWADATNVNVIIGSSGIRLYNKSTGVDFVITAANWKIIVKAWL